MQHHPFAELIDWQEVILAPGTSELTLQVQPQHMNPQQVVHGAVLFALADTGMGAALYPSLQPGELCATIEIKITYFKPVRAGQVVCKTVTMNRGKTIANLESCVFVNEVLVAKASGNYAIFRPSAV